jgi:hypothetical protein
LAPSSFNPFKTSDIRAKSHASKLGANIGEPAALNAFKRVGLSDCKAVMVEMGHLDAGGSERIID